MNILIVKAVDDVTYRLSMDEIYFFNYDKKEDKTVIYMRHCHAFKLHGDKTQKLDKILKCDGKIYSLTD